MNKTIKFRDSLAKLVLSHEKDITWRLFDDKDLKEDDHVDLINSDTQEKFGEAILVKVWEKKMKDLDVNDYDGHEKFSDNEEMYATYRSYYGDRVEPETLVKVIRFQLQ